MAPASTHQRRLSSVGGQPALVLLRGSARAEAAQDADPSPSRMSSFPNPEDEERDAAGAESSRVLERVVAKFKGLLSIAATRHQLDPAERDALTQELRLRLWRALKDNATISHVAATYVQRATMSAALDLLRRRREREEALPDEDGVATPSMRSGDRADSLLEAGDVARAVERALLVLPESRRAVVRLHLRGYERDEIGSLLGWSEAKTRNLLYRGLDDLRAELTRLGFGPDAR